MCLLRQCNNMGIIFKVRTEVKVFFFQMFQPKSFINQLTFLSKHSLWPCDTTPAIKRAKSYHFFQTTSLSAKLVTGGRYVGEMLCDELPLERNVKENSEPEKTKPRRRRSLQDDDKTKDQNQENYGKKAWNKQGSSSKDEWSQAWEKTLLDENRARDKKRTKTRLKWDHINRKEKVTC